MRFNSAIIFVTVLVALTFSCSSKEENKPPFCLILRPLPNSVFTIEDDLMVIVNGDDSDGSIVAITLLLNADEIASSNSSPLEYTYDLDGFDPDDYTLKASVTDDKGGESSKEIQISVHAALEEFTDSRDGNAYRYVTIGEQTWMAENLAYLPEVSPSIEISDITPRYYVLGYEENDVSAAKAHVNYSFVEWQTSLPIISVA